MKVAVLEKLLGMRQVLKLNELMDMSPQSKNLFKFSHLMVTNRPICEEKKKEFKMLMWYPTYSQPTV